MPVFDGVSACKVIRKTGSQIPIIAFTANVLTHEVEQYLQIGFDDYLGKPIDTKLLYELLDKMLK